MPALRQLALLLLLPLGLAAQTASPTEPVQPQPVQPHTTLPSDSNCRARPTWCQAARDRVAAAKGHPVDILFLGDSITEGWTAVEWGGEKRGAAVWEKTYVPLHALNFGVGADTTQNVLYRLDTMDVQDLHPKVTVLLIGTNNARDTAIDITAGIRAILARLRVMYPSTRVILVSILPNARARDLMVEANTLIRPLADNQTVFYLDLAANMIPVGDNWLGLGPDKLHPNQIGYQLWADSMEPLLTRLLAMPPIEPAVPATDAPTLAPAAKP